MKKLVTYKLVTYKLLSLLLRILYEFPMHLASN